MPVEVTWAEGCAAAEADRTALEASVLACLAAEGSPEALVSVHLAEDGLLHELNRRYRGVDAPTDVLSFGLGDPPPGAAMGDVVISVPRAKAQARALGHGERRELCFLAVHGTLHLLGYDDADEAGNARMAARAEAVLAGVGVPR